MISSWERIERRKSKGKQDPLKRKLDEENGKKKELKASLSERNESSQEPELGRRGIRFEIETRKKEILFAREVPLHSITF